MKLDPLNISMRLKSRMNELNIKQKDIYLNADISQSAFNRYINGQRIPDAEALVNITKILNISIEYLLTGSDSGPELPDREQTLLDLYRQLSPEDQIKIFGYIEAKLPEQRPSERKKA